MTTTAPTPTFDPGDLEAFVGRYAEDFGTLLHAVTVLLGDRLGLYRAMANGEPMSSAEVADASGVEERYVREWLAAQYVAGYVEYDPASERFRLPPAHAAALVEGMSPFYVPGAYLIAGSGFKDVERIVDALGSGRAFGWHEHDRDLFIGTEKLFRPGYAANLVDHWIPALDGVKDKLRTGAKVADIGCGLGASTILMAEAYPRSTFVGFDYHDASIALARTAAASASVTDRVRFEVASADDFPGDGYDLVATFDCLHDLGDPAGAARHVRASLAPGGTWMIVEPMAGERLEDNNNPVGKIFYAASTFICTPASRAQRVGAALGAQTPERTLRELVIDAGFGRFRRATETPFNRILEASVPGGESV